MGLNRSFVRSAERTTAGSRARGRRNGICLRYKLGVAARLEMHKMAGHDAGNTLAGLTSAVAKGLGTVRPSALLSYVTITYFLFTDQAISTATLYNREYRRRCSLLP